METAIGAHDFDRAKACSDEERRERENLRQLAEKYHLTGDAGGFIPSGGRIGEVRRRIEAAIPHRPKTSTSQDLPLSQPAKRVLSLGAEEAKRMKHDRIGPEHLFLGLLREESSLAARVLSDMGLRVNKVRAEIASGPAQPDRPSSAALRDTPASGLRASGMDSMMHGLQDASRVLFLARGEASKRQNPCIETTDLLLALANEKEVNERFLGPARPAILSLASQPAPQHEHVATEELAFSKDCKLVFGYAAEEAAQLGQRTGPEHLLLGILRAETCAAAEILRASGLTASGIRAQLTLPPPSSDPEQGRNYV
jgi:ATP-dependent Clp protease ATP-binding subunit ClpA